MNSPAPNRQPISPHIDDDTIDPKVGF